MGVSPPYKAIKALEIITIVMCEFTMNIPMKKLDSFVDEGVQSPHFEYFGCFFQTFRGPRAHILSLVGQK